MTLARSIAVPAIALLIAFASVRPGVAANAGAMATFNQFIDGFNKGDAKTAVAACASPASVIDEFPPHHWQGATACADWFRAFDAVAKGAGITNATVTLGKPWHVDVSGDVAYIVAPATYAYKVRGKPASESGIFTLSLTRGAAGWRITAWAWAKH